MGMRGAALASFFAMQQDGMSSAGGGISECTKYVHAERAGDRKTGAIAPRCAFTAATVPPIIAASFELDHPPQESRSARELLV